MPYIKVDTGRLSGFGNTSAAARGRVGSIKSSFSSIGSALDWDVKACSGINRTISQINNELSNEMASLKRMEAFFDMAVRKYNDADEAKPEAKKVHTSSVQKIVPGNFRSTTKNATLTSILKSNQIASAKKVEIPEGFKEKVQKLLFDIAKEAGIVGGVLGILEDENSFISKIREGDYIGAASSFGHVAKRTYKTISKVIKKGINMAKVSPMLHWTTQVKSWGKTLLGLDNYFNPKTVGVASKASKTTTRIYNNFQKAKAYEFGNITKADVIISCIFNAVENYSDAKSGEMSAGRAVVETVTETAIDVVIDAALYAGTAAVLAGVAGTAAVPAIAIGAVVVGVKWLLDIAANAITKSDKGFTEWVSDGIINAAVWVGNGAKKVVNAVAPVIRDACTKVVNTVKDTANKVIGNVKQGVKNFFGKLRFAF